MKYLNDFIVVSLFSFSHYRGHDVVTTIHQLLGLIHAHQQEEAFLGSRQPVGFLAFARRTVLDVDRLLLIDGSFFLGKFNRKCLLVFYLN